MDWERWILGCEAKTLGHKGGGLGGVDTSWCVNDDVGTRREWTQGGMPARTLGAKGGALGGPTSIREGNEY